MEYKRLTEQQKKTVLKNIPLKHTKKFLYSVNKEKIHYRLKIMYRPLVIGINILIALRDIMKGLYIVTQEIMTELVEYSFSDTVTDWTYYNTPEKLDKEEFF